MDDHDNTSEEATSARGTKSTSDLESEVEVPEHDAAWSMPINVAWRPMTPPHAAATARPPYVSAISRGTTKVSAHIKKRTDQDLAARCAPRLSNGSNRDVCCNVEGYVREARRSTRSQTSRWPRGAEPLGLGDTEAKESASCRHRFPGLVRARAQCRPREDNWTVRFPSAQPSLPPPAFCLSLGSSAPFLPGFKIGIYRVSDRRGGSPPGAMSCLHDHSCEDHNCSADWSLHTHIDLSKVVDGI
ncbi:hypothetical protein BHE74_00005119 [Ensete ventricosum]|nr:hypothetical protein BHE74_00005119 [Ensete ventricosum]